MRVVQRLAGLLILVVALGAQAQTAARPDRFGDAMQVALPLAAAGWSLYQGDIEGLKEYGVSLAVSELATEGLKRAVNDPRPTGSGGGFVSGHASRAFVSAAYIHRRYGLGPAVPMYALATATAYSRVHTGHHYTRQVLRGAAVGVGSAVVFTKHLSERSQAALVPTAGGLAFTYATSW